jgi:hypothetical protein
MRQDQFAITASVDGRDLGVFETFSGGEIDSEETTYKLGAMGPRVSLGGSVNVGNVTIGKLSDLVWSQSIIHWLIGRAGKGTLTIKKQPLDVDGNAFGRPLTYTGKLKQVTPPEADANSSDAAVLELELTPAGTVT